MLNQVYTKLYNLHGPQNWWPVTKTGRNELQIYEKREFLTEQQKLEICIGTILTQNTNWKNVEKSIILLNKKKLINLRKLADIKQEKLAQLIRSSGYFNQKAERLILFAKYVLNKYGDVNKLLNKPLNELREELLSLKGIGPETADSIILYAAQKPSFVIDAYTKRVFSRIGFCEKDLEYHKLQEEFHKSLIKNYKLFNEYHALIVEHAKQYCKKIPECQNCPLSSLCQKRI